ncbi:YmfL family putative regulatory protein [Rahnella sp. NRRL B-41462]|uniref:YmfL family putative regulatory protein n=1 Tax=Rahnella sp. NRRL B-41462 TaxID=1610579 RepID=UPI000DD42D07|nr:YmfL family putative regulatory protein [Rahnella sp. NRRL B-41462]
MVDLKSVVKAMCKAYPGGRSAMAGALGMSEAGFNNNLYEKNGCRFFEIAELEAMEDISGTSYLAEYFSQRRGGLFVDIPQLDELDQVELFSKSMRTAAHRGHVDMIIQAALEDGVIDEAEAAEIMKYHHRHLSARDAEVRAVLALFGKKSKAGKGDAQGVQSPGVGALTNRVE